MLCLLDQKHTKSRNIGHHHRPFNPPVIHPPLTFDLFTSFSTIIIVVNSLLIVLKTLDRYFLLSLPLSLFFSTILSNVCASLTIVLYISFLEFEPCDCPFNRIHMELAFAPRVCELSHIKWTILLYANKSEVVEGYYMLLTIRKKKSRLGK